MAFPQPKTSNLKPNSGQTMLLVVMMISGIVLSVSLVAGILMIYQIRQAGNFTNSAKAIFAADAGVNWWFFSQTPSYNPAFSSSTVNADFGNGASFEIIELPNGTAKVVGQAGNSRRAFLVTSLAPHELIPCAAKLDMIILVDRSNSMLNMPIIKTKLKDFLDLLGVSASQAHVGQITFSAGTFWHITDNLTDAKSNVDLINVNAGSDYANLASAIVLALAEFSNTGDLSPIDKIPDHPPNHASPNPPAGDYPDYMVIITDDRPNLPLAGPLTAATNVASAAKTAGVEIFVVYQGTDNADMDFFKDNIVSSPSSTHFYSTSGFDVDSPLNKMLVCG